MQPIRPEVRRLRTQMRSRERVETVTSILLSGTTPPPPGVLSWTSDSVILSVDVARDLETNYPFMLCYAKYFVHRKQISILTLYNHFHLKHES